MSDVLTLFLCGDVMTGRGVDQILPCPSLPEIHESYVRDARDYVLLAEEANGRIPRAVEPSYVWGDARDELERVAPDARIINLETSVTRSDQYWPGKGINYRMHPHNVTCLTVAKMDICALANNHVLDYGYPGLAETIETLKGAGIDTVGAGADLTAARLPAIRDISDMHRVIVFAVGSESSGIPRAWAATEHRWGVDLLTDLSDAAAAHLVKRIQDVRREGDVTVASIHWGSNWGYEVPAAHTRFAHALIDGGVDVIHGHSSHHPRPIEVYRNKLVLYGCGDFIDDYEGISGYETFRDDSVLMYFPAIRQGTGELLGLRLVPMRIRKMRLNRASIEEATWLQATINRVSDAFGSRVEHDRDRGFVLRWRCRA